MSFKPYYGTPITGYFYESCSISEYVPKLEEYIKTLPSTNKSTRSYLLGIKEKIIKKQMQENTESLFNEIWTYAPKLPLVSIFNKYMTNRSTLIPFISNTDFNRAIENCSSVILDNSAFTFWRNGTKVDDIFWNKYYSWVREIYHTEKLDWFIIPDVIMGSESENDRLISKFLKTQKDIAKKGVPVWHTNESHERLKLLCDKFERVCIGSANEKVYGKVGSDKWFSNLDLAFSKIDFNNQKIHLLRFMKKSNIIKLKRFKKYNISFSGDSTNFAQNHHRFTKRDKEPNILLFSQRI